MIDGSTIAALGFGISLCGTIGGFIVRDRQTQDKITLGDSKLHERLNRVKEKYVNRQNLNDVIEPIRKSLERVEKQNSVIYEHLMKKK